MTTVSSVTPTHYHSQFFNYSETAIQQKKWWEVRDLLKTTTDDFQMLNNPSDEVAKRILEAFLKPEGIEIRAGRKSSLEKLRALTKRSNRWIEAANFWKFRRTEDLKKLLGSTSCSQATHAAGLVTTPASTNLPTEKNALSLQTVLAAWHETQGSDEQFLKLITSVAENNLIFNPAKKKKNNFYASYESVHAFSEAINTKSALLQQHFQAKAVESPQAFVKTLQFLDKLDSDYFSWLENRHSLKKVPLRENDDLEIKKARIHIQQLFPLELAAYAPVFSSLNILESSISSERITPSKNLASVEEFIQDLELPNPQNNHLQQFTQYLQQNNWQLQGEPPEKTECGISDLLRMAKQWLLEEIKTRLEEDASAA